tara:strand:+ start:621 stop:1394 length:774 start_codon:yes stop_codon:yes gene_type:complete
MSSNVAKKKETNVAEFDASIFEADAGKGLENIGQDDLALPFIKILSGLDPVLDDLEEARKGDIYNTVSSQIYKGKQGIQVVPCSYQRRFIEWAPRGSGTGAPLNIFTPENELPKTERSADDNREYVVGGEGSYLEETHQHFVVIIEEDGSSSTALIAMKSTQLKKSRKWNSMIASRSLVGKNGPFTPPRYSHVYLLKTVSEENSKGSWHGWDISLVGQVQDIGLYGAAKAFAESISTGDVEVKHQQDGSGSKDNAPF